MPISEELLTTIEQILTGSNTEADLLRLRQLLGGAVAPGERSLAINGNANGATITTGNGNIVVNIVFQADGLRIGESNYHGDGAEMLRSLLQTFVESKVEIDWSQISQRLLEQQIQRLTSNPLTHAEGITHRTDQVYIPLGLVERKRQSRRGEDVSPEQGSQLYKETEITRQFEHDEFLEQVLRHGNSPRSDGRRLAIIGEPGAGKTTLLQQTGQWVSDNIDGSIVIWISLADFQGELLEDYLLERWLTATVRQAGKADVSSSIKDAFVAQFQQDNVWLMLDGADEMQILSGNPLSEIERQVRAGGLLSQARIVLTCRLNLWDGHRHALDTFDTYRTLEFSYPDQVEQFIGRWFEHLPDTQSGQAENLCSALRASGKERIRDLVKNPLRLTLLCFNGYLGNGELPETKAGLYEQFVEDFYEWKREQFPTTAEQRRQLNVALGELAREAIDNEETRFRLQHDFACHFLGEPDEDGTLFNLALTLGWLNKIGVAEEDKRKLVYAFFHPTFQEYFSSLSINDWHFFLNHMSENPLSSESSYRIFEQKWREVFLLWLGKPINDNVYKENIINALINFEYSFNGVNYYGNRAKLIVAAGLSEFQSFSRSQEIINWLLDLSISQIRTFNDPVSSTARGLLKELPTSLLSNTLTMLLNSNYARLQNDAASLAGELKLRNSEVFEALMHLASTTQFKDTRCNTFCSLLSIDPMNSSAVDGLIEILDSGEMGLLAVSAAEKLRYAEVKKEKIISALENCIPTQLSIPQHELACAAALSLLKYEHKHEKAIGTLRELAQKHWITMQRIGIKETLDEMGVEVSDIDVSDIQTPKQFLEENFKNMLSELGLDSNLEPLELIEKIIEIMITEQSYEMRKKAAWGLEQVLDDVLPSISTALYPRTVSLLKRGIDLSPDRGDADRALITVGTQKPVVACEKGLWAISEWLSFGSFFTAWSSQVN